MVRRLAVVLAVLGAAHYYIWLRFVHAPRLPEPWYAIATIVIAGLAPSLIISAILSRRMPRERAAPLLRVVFAWFGIAVYLLVAAALTDLACALAPIGARTAALAGIAGVAVTVGYGFVHLRRGPRVRRVSVPLAKLPAAADGYTIVQLTDVHVGPTLGREFVTKVVAQVMALAPDLIVVTGDLIDGRLVDLAPHVEPLRELHARDGVFAVTGNHEYYWNADAWIRTSARSGCGFCATSACRSRQASSSPVSMTRAPRRWRKVTAKMCLARSQVATRRCPSCCSLIIRARSAAQSPPAATSSCRDTRTAASYCRSAGSLGYSSRASPGSADRIDLALRQRRHRLLGTAAARRHDVRDHVAHAASAGVTIGYGTCAAAASTRDRSAPSGCCAR